VTVYFENCVGYCANATIELNGMRISEVIDACTERWGSGALCRANKQLVWKHDMDTPYLGCCLDRGIDANDRKTLTREDF
jgi:hypothetical protein